MDPDRLSKAVVDLVGLVARLRGPGGCPWDARQTDSTIKLYLLEEAYEVLEAIEKSSASEVCSELGDLLFHILILARLAEERKEFDFVAVVERITEKMMRRHPHVFGETKVDNVEDVVLNWAMIKKEEKGNSRDTFSLLKDVPMNLPALLKAHRLNERAPKADSNWPTDDEIWDEVLEKFEELSAAVTIQDRNLFSEKMGDLLFCLANLARHWGFNSEHLLRIANRKFLDHFEKIEATTQVHGLPASGGARGDQGSRWERDED